MREKMFLVNLRRELRRNNSIRVKVFIAGFRLTNFFFEFDKTRVLYALSNCIYKTVCFFFKIDILARTRIGWGLRIFHPFCICIHPDVRIGDDCILRHGVTLGNKGESSSVVPSVGNGVEFGCYAVVFGGVSIPDGARVRALSLTTESERSKVAIDMNARDACDLDRESLCGFDRP